MSLVAAITLLTACGPSTGPKPPEFEPVGQSKCGVVASPSKPLIVEWPSADRLELESRLKAGLVAVAYSGCEMRVLPACKGTAPYHYVSGTPKRDVVTIHDADELYATLPAGAAALEGKLERSGTLNVDMTLVGRWEADTDDASKLEVHGECADATHVITALTVGAFEFYAGAASGEAASAGILGAKAGGESTSARESLSQDGDVSSCAAGGESPPPACGALLRVEVMPTAAATSDQVRSVENPGDENESPEEASVVPKELGVDIDAMSGTPFSLEQDIPGGCESYGKLDGEDGPFLVGQAGLRYALTRRVRVRAWAEFGTQFQDDDRVWGGGAGVGYRLSQSLAVTGALGVDSIKTRGDVYCNSKLSSLDKAVVVGWLELGARVALVQDSWDSWSVWAGVASRFGAGFTTITLPTTAGDVTLNEDPALHAYGLLGVSF